MMTRRITLTLAAATLALILIGVLVFAATADDATADTTATAAETDTGQDSTSADDEAATTEIEPAAEHDRTVDGGGLYATHCASCHGDAGQGGSGGPVDDLDLTLDQVIDITANGVPRMPAYAEVLTPEEIQAVSHYTVSLNGNS